MSFKNTEPAFPGVVDIERFEESLGKYVPHLVPMGGLTKREWFAGMALQGLMAQGSGMGSNIWKPEEAAKLSFSQADAMIEANKK